jgi:hypothetical protein
MPTKHGNDRAHLQVRSHDCRVRRACGGRRNWAAARRLMTDETRFTSAETCIPLSRIAVVRLEHMVTPERGDGPFHTSAMVPSQVRRGRDTAEECDL